MNFNNDLNTALARLSQACHDMTARQLDLQACADARTCRGCMQSACERKVAATRARRRFYHEAAEVVRVYDRKEP